MPTTSIPTSSPNAVADSVVRNADTAIEDRRSTERVAKRLSLNLTPVGGIPVQRCTVENISAGGLYLKVPADADLSVGQRCEAIFCKDPGLPHSADLADETCYATVVRTKRVAEGSRDVIGAGLRFDQPLFL